MTPWFRRYNTPHIPMPQPQPQTPEEAADEAKWRACVTKFLDDLEELYASLPGSQSYNQKCIARFWYGGKQS